MGCGKSNRYMIDKKRSMHAGFNGLQVKNYALIYENWIAIYIYQYINGNPI